MPIQSRYRVDRNRNDTNRFAIINPLEHVAFADIVAAADFSRNYRLPTLRNHAFHIKKYTR